MGGGGREGGRGLIGIDIGVVDVVPVRLCK